jgi:DNA-binding transcriptional regulator YiaG
MITWALTTTHDGHDRGECDGAAASRAEALDELIAQAAAQVESVENAGTVWTLALDGAEEAIIGLGPTADGEPNRAQAHEHLALVHAQLAHPVPWPIAEDTTAGNTADVHDDLAGLWSSLRSAVLDDGSAVAAAAAPKLTAAGVRSAREALGMDEAMLARLLDIDERTVRRWERGENPIPTGVARELQAVDARYTTLVDQIADHYRHGRLSSIETYQSVARTPDAPLTARFHRTLCHQVVRKVPGLTVVYKTGDTT